MSLFRFKKLFIFFSLIMFFISCNNSDGLGKKPDYKVRKSFTKEDPGHWKGKEDGHVPIVKIFEGKSKDNIHIYVSIKNPSQSHYIEKIGIMDENGRDLVVKNLPVKRVQSLVKVVFTLYPLPKGKNIKVYAKCSLHDLWTTPLFLEK